MANFKCYATAVGPGTRVLWLDSTGSGRSSQYIVVFFSILTCLLFFPLQQSQRAGSVSLNAEEMSKSIPFLVRPDKLDGSMAGDMGFDPMRL